MTITVPLGVVIVPPYWWSPGRPVSKCTRERAFSSRNLHSAVPDALQEDAWTKGQLRQVFLVLDVNQARRVDGSSEWLACCLTDVQADFKVEIVGWWGCGKGPGGARTEQRAVPPPERPKPCSPPSRRNCSSGPLGGPAMTLVQRHLERASEEPEVAPPPITTLSTGARRFEEIDSD
eukprot:1147830-Rhodomonas_salina.1